DGELHTQAVGATHEAGDEQLQLGVGDATVVRGVDGGQHGRVEYVDVDVQPVAHAVGQVFACPLDGTGGTIAAQLRDRPVGDPGGLEVQPVLVLRPDTEQRHVLVADVRAQSLQVSKVGLAPAGDQGKVLPGRGSHVGGVARVPEVGVAVEVDQPVRQLVPG